MSISDDELRLITQVTEDLLCAAFAANEDNYPKAIMNLHDQSSFNLKDDSTVVNIAIMQGIANAVEAFDPNYVPGEHPKVDDIITYAFSLFDKPLYSPETIAEMIKGAQCMRRTLIPKNVRPPKSPLGL